MKNYLNLDDIPNLQNAIDEVITLKKDAFANEHLGKHKTLGMLFFNPSLRTRLSTQKAAQHMGLKTMVMNFSNEAWALEFEDGTKMSGLRSEHIKEAAAVISQYCDMVAIRAFATLSDKQKDESEQVLNNFARYASIPIINMESATAHPLQALADAVTLKEYGLKKRPKIVLTWAPHPKALPHAVGNSFTRMVQKLDAEFVIAQPKGYELNPEITKNTPLIYDQDEALEGADFVYAKNWCSYEDYGKILRTDDQWMLTAEKMKLTNQAKFMHCLPIRRNIVVSDNVLDHSSSLVIQQANNRTYAAQWVLKQLLENG
ncbi:MAG: N-acetylornithine carbamoyltransferase [Flavobacteriaceae bacterium]|nr:N-acetylornithine carbamoyltransferase [Flavobacteriaceae bacterium]